MRFPRYVAMLILATLPFASHADVLTYDFSANISWMGIYDGHDNNDVDSSSLPGVLVAKGDHLKGRITYATSGPVSYVSADGLVKIYDNVIQSYSFTVASSGFSYTSAYPYNGVVVSADPKNKVLAFTTSALTPEVSLYSALSLASPTGSALSTPDIPSELSLAAFGQSEVSYAWVDNASGLTLYFHATTESLTRISAVPEPGQWSMFGLGAAMLAGLARRKHVRGIH